MTHHTIFPLISRAKQILIAAALLIQPGFLPAGQSELPDLGDRSETVLSPRQEKHLGAQFIRQARRQLPFIDEPELTQYLQRLGDRLVKHSDAKGLRFHFYLINSPEINAFAVPGGYIAVNTGLVLAAKSEGELASVLAHEIAHVNQRHIARLLAARESSMGPALAAILAGMVAINSGNAEAGEAAIMLSSAGLAQQTINFTRTHEEEADRVGTGILYESGFDARDMPKFFKRMADWGRLYETNLPEFLRTHPVTLNRIADSENRASQFAKRKNKTSSDFHHFQARVRATYQQRNQAEVIKSFQDNLKARDHVVAQAQRYGYVWALAKDGQHNSALQQSNLLIRKFPTSRRYQLARAEIEFLAGNYKKAGALYQRVYRKWPRDLPVLKKYGTLLIRTQKMAKAKSVLSGAAKLAPEDPDIHKMLAKAHGETGDKLKAHESMAQYYYLTGDAISALQQLELARGFAGKSFYHRERLNARIKAIRGGIPEGPPKP